MDQNLAKPTPSIQGVDGMLAEGTHIAEHYITQRNAT
jgi:hypothetical protein